MWQKRFKTLNKKRWS